jgi:hypothetical protein
MTCPRCKGQMHLLRTCTLPELEGEWHLRMFRCVWCGTVLGPVVQTHFLLESRESLPHKVVSKEQAVKSPFWKELNSPGLRRRGWSSLSTTFLKWRALWLARKYPAELSGNEQRHPARIRNKGSGSS